MELWVKKIFVSSPMRFKPKHFDQVCFGFHHIYFEGLAEYQVGKNTPKLNLPPKAHPNEGLFLGAPPAKII